MTCGQIPSHVMALTLPPALLMKQPGFGVYSLGETRDSRWHVSVDTRVWSEGVTSLQTLPSWLHVRGINSFTYTDVLSLR